MQLRQEHPSHIVMPAIHIKKEEVGETFHRHLGTEKGASDPKYLTEASAATIETTVPAGGNRDHGSQLRHCGTGGFVVCTNEGNADLCLAPSPCTSPVWGSKN
ncbi:MAG: hypothetical protein R3C12_00390 [Planctomycetaceae bacterium]